MKILMKIVAVFAWCASLGAYPTFIERWVNKEKGISIDIIGDAHVNLPEPKVMGLGEKIEHIFNEVDAKSSEEIALLWEYDPKDLDGADAAQFRALLQGDKTDIIGEVGYFLRHQKFEKSKFIPVDVLRSIYARDYYLLLQKFAQCDGMIGSVQFDDVQGHAFIQKIQKSIKSILECDEINYFMGRATDLVCAGVLQVKHDALNVWGAQLLGKISADKDVTAPIYNDQEFQEDVEDFFCEMMNFEVLLNLFSAYSYDGIKKFVVYVGGQHGESLGDFFENYPGFECEFYEDAGDDLMVGVDALKERMLSETFMAKKRKKSGDAPAAKKPKVEKIVIDLSRPNSGGK